MVGSRTCKTESKLVLVEMEWGPLVEEPPNLGVHTDLQGRGIGDSASKAFNKMAVAS